MLGKNHGLVLQICFSNKSLQTFFKYFIIFSTGFFKLYELYKYT